MLLHLFERKGIRGERKQKIDAEHARYFVGKVKLDRRNIKVESEFSYNILKSFRTLRKDQHTFTTMVFCTINILLFFKKVNNLKQPLFCRFLRA